MMTLEMLTRDELARLCAPAFDDEPGFGALSTAQGNLPLKLLDVHAKVVGLVATTTVRQTFVNTLGVPLEATYIFPLPDRAAVSRFRFEVGERVIEGTLKERGQARREYDQAIASGHRAAITEEERPGVFTMRVGNLMPGEEASVHLDLCGPVAFSEGEATFRFPLVVAPRYIPGTALAGDQVGDGTARDTDAVPDASRISPPVLLPGFPNPVRLGLTVEVDPAGVALQGVRSSLHAVTEAPAGEGVVVRVQPGERLDRDFILRWTLGSDAVETALTLHPDADDGDTRDIEGTFQLTLVPPAGLAKTVQPRDVAFVLDRSGSMGGWKMIAARRACARMLDTLTDRDRFCVLAFDHGVERPARLDASGLSPASDRNRFRAVEFLAGLEARGGTEMAAPLQEAVGALTVPGGPGEPARDRVLILITDGQVGNEDQILRSLGAQLEQVRVFTLGIDQAVNAGFLRRMAAVGGGYCELVESEDRLDEVMDKVHRRIGTPLLTHLAVEEAGLTLVPESLEPARLPDLFAGTPLTILGRFRGAASGELTVRARDGVGLAWNETVSGKRSESVAATRVWARGRIRDLEDRYAVTSDRALVPVITSTSLRFGVLCRFTSFVAVDRSEVVNEGGQLHRVTQGVEQPAGWEATDAKLDGAFSMIDASRSDPFAAPAGPPPAFGGGYADNAPADPFAGSPPGGALFDAFEVTADEADPFCAPPGSAFGGDPFAAPASMPPSSVPPASDPFGSDDGVIDLDDVLGGAAPKSAFAPPPPPAPRASGRRRSKHEVKRPKHRVRREAEQRRAERRAATPDALGRYRRRLEDLLRLLAGGVEAARELRQRELARLLLQLETLLEDLRSVGTDEPTLRPLTSLVEDLAPVRGGPLDEAALTQLETRAREVLEAFLNTPHGAPDAGRREGFWM